MSNPSRESMEKLSQALINMSDAWIEAGGVPPTLKEMDGGMTALDLVMIMALNHIEFSAQPRVHVGVSQ